MTPTTGAMLPGSYSLQRLMHPIESVLKELRRVAMIPVSVATGSQPVGMSLQASCLRLRVGDTSSALSDIAFRERSHQ